MNILDSILIITSIVLIILVLIQQRGNELGMAFGGSGEFFSQRRGFEKIIFYATIASAGIFIVLSLVRFFS